MSNLITTFLVAVSAFVATNIDDIVILLLLFAQINSSFRSRHIIAGQYLGFTVLVVASLPGLFGGLILPPNWIGLLGLIPIAMGISNVINREDVSQDVAVVTAEYQDSNTVSFLNAQTYSVAAITIANGSDNISVYVPLFASSDLLKFVITVGVFFLLIALWCYLAYKLTSQPTFANNLSQQVSYISPFVLIFLGSFIILKMETLSLMKLAASCVCLMILVKKTS